VKAKARLVAVIGRSGKIGARFAMALPAMALLVLSIGGVAHAAYPLGTPLQVGAGKLVTSVAVNQASKDVYAASGGSTASLTTGAGEVKRFIFGGGSETCASPPYPEHPFGIGINPTSGSVSIVDGGTTKSIKTFAAGCGAQSNSFNLAGSAGLVGNFLPQPAVDSTGKIYYPRNALSGKVEVFEPTGSSGATVVGAAITGLVNPNVVTLDAAGNRYVVQPREKPGEEIQTVSFSGSPTGGSFSLTFAGETKTIAYSSTPATLQANIKAGLESLPLIGAGNVFLEGENVKFIGALTGTNVPQMTCDGTALTGGTSPSCSVSTNTDGVAGSDGSLFKYAPVGDNTLLETFYSGQITSAAVDAATGNVFIGVGYGGTGYPGKGFHIEKFSSAGVKLADFGDGAFTSGPQGSSVVALNQLAVNQTDGTVYATDSGGEKVEVFKSEVRPKFLLKAEKTGPGAASGKVSSDIAGIDCGATCQHEYEEQELITLSAQDEGGATFVKWESCPEEFGTENRKCRVKITAAKTVKAEFNGPAGKALKVVKEGTGTGTVTSAQSGVGAEPVNCGSHCEELFTTGTPVTLTATPAAHSTFAGWSVTGEPGACPGTGTCEVTMSADKEVHASFNQINRSFSVNTGGGSGTGAVKCNGIACASSYPEGTVLTLTATPGAHSAFSSWSITGDPGTTCTGTTSPCTVTVEADITAGASFDLISRSFSVNTSGGTGTGVVKCNGVSCASSYPETTVLTLTATPNAHSAFSGWSVTGDPGTTCTGTTSPCTLTVEADISVSAPFNQITHTLTINQPGSGSGTLSCDAGSGPEACKASYNEATEVTISQSAAFGSEFKGWSGCDSEPAGKCKVTLSSDKSVSATFDLEPGQKNLTVNVTGEGEVKCKVGAGSFGSCAPSYPEGTSLTLQGTAGPHASFSGWSGGTGSASACSGSGNCAFTINADSSVNAPFPLIQRSLTINKAGTGNGSFECDSGSGFGSCQASYADGTTITVKAIPNGSSTFAGWSGGGCSGTGNCVISAIAANTTVTGTFTLIQRTLSVNKAGTGNGSFECDSGSGFGSCASTYADGTTITVKATPNANSTFAGWSGGGCSGTGNCVISAIAANTTVTGTFNLNQSTLTISKSGAGDGSFTCDTGSGPGACLSAYANGTTVTIATTPDSHSAFAGWSGSGCSGTGICVITLSSNKTVSAAFSLAQRTLTIDKSGSGDGSFECDTGSGYGPCQASYADGTTLVVKAIPDSNSTFAGWSGCDSQPGAGKCAIEGIDSNTTIAATFAAIPPAPPAGGGGSSAAGSAGSAPASSSPPAVTPPPTEKPLTCRKGTKKRMVKGKPRCVKAKPHRRHRQNHRRRITLAELIRRTF
jgi:List-Bact-rpt repeat protein